MVTFDLASPMHDWQPGDYPVDPIVLVTVLDETGDLLRSADLATTNEIETFFNRAIFELKILPKDAEQSRDAAKRELATQQARIRARA